MKLLLLLLAGVGNHWIRINGSYATHAYYVTHYGNVIGDYYQPHKPSYQPVELPNPFTAQCDEGKPVEFQTESQARTFIEACPE